MQHEMAQLVCDRPSGALPGIQLPQSNQWPIPKLADPCRATQVLLQSAALIFFNALPAESLTTHHDRHAVLLQQMRQVLDRLILRKPQLSASLRGRRDGTELRARCQTQRWQLVLRVQLQQKVTRQRHHLRHAILLRHQRRLRRPEGQILRLHVRLRGGHEKHCGKMQYV